MKIIGNSVSIREKMSTSFGWHFEIWAVQRYVNLVDPVKSFPTSIYLQQSASIQPRTSLSKFGRKLNSLFIRLLTSAASPPATRPRPRRLRRRRGPGPACSNASPGRPRRWPRPFAASGARFLLRAMLQWSREGGKLIAPFSILLGYFFWSRPRVNLF